MSHSIVYPDADPHLESLLCGDSRQRLEALGSLVIFSGRPQGVDDFLSRIGDARGLLLGWELPSAVMRKAPKLEVVSFTGTGAGNMVDLAEASRLGITVTNTPGYANDSVAEHALGLLLSVAHKIAQGDRGIRTGHWGQQGPGVELRGKTLGLVGFGGIGSRMAELASAIGMKVIAWTRHPERHSIYHTTVEFAPLDGVLSQADALSLHLALNPDTEGLFGVKEFDLMKKGVLLVNTARSELLDEDTLIRRLRTGTIAGAGLDVFSEEPLPSEHPLCKLQNVVLTPHSAFQMPEASARLLDTAISNLEAFFDGRPMNVVNDPKSA